MIDLRYGDCIEKMKEIEDNSVDLILTDPPYHLTSIVKRFGKKGSAPASTKNNDGSFSRLSKGFMGKEWDGLDENGGIAFNVDMWKEVYRLLKDDGYLMAFSGTRTYHRMAKAIEEAGFEIVGLTDYTYASGFPKALSIDKAINAKIKTGGSSPKNLRKDRMGEHYEPTGQIDYSKGRMFSSDIKNDDFKVEFSDIAKQFTGYKTQIKPSHEPIVIAKKKSNTNNIDFLPFIYCAKASKKERNGDIYGNPISGELKQKIFNGKSDKSSTEMKDVEKRFTTQPMVNNHPTVKPLKIMKECAKQVIKDKDITILDIFAGSGSTGVAIEQLNIETGSNHKCILIEREKEYIEIIKKRCCIK